MTHVRNQDIAVEGEFTSNSMRLKLSIDLDDLLRDGRVLWIGKWDPDGAFFLCVRLYCLEVQTGHRRMTSHFMPITLAGHGRHDFMIKIEMRSITRPHPYTGPILPGQTSSHSLHL